MTEVVDVRAPSHGSRPVFAIQVAVLVVVLVGSFGLLLSAMARSGDYAAFFHPGLERLGDPKDSMTPIGPDSLGNPLLWIFGLSRTAAFFVRPVAAIATLLGVASLVPAWRARDRRAVARLAAVTGVWLTLGVISFTPYGVALTGWLLD